MTNQLYYGDNLQVLRDSIATETVYLDPPFNSQAVKTGYYETPYGKYPKIQIFTIAELFAGKKPNIPLVDPSAFNRPAVEGDRSKQEKLF